MQSSMTGPRVPITIRKPAKTPTFGTIETRTGVGAKIEVRQIWKWDMNYQNLQYFKQTDKNLFFGRAS